MTPSAARLSSHLWRISTEAGKTAQVRGLLPLPPGETKSTSVAQDLFYTFDHVGRFQAAQVSKDAAALHALNFIDFGALGYSDDPANRR